MNLKKQIDRTASETFSDRTKEAYRKYNADSKAAFKKWQQNNPDAYDTDELNDWFDSPDLTKMLGKYGMNRMWDGSNYTKEYLEGYGRTITMSHLKDLGFEDSDAKKYTDRLLKSGRTLNLNDADGRNYKLFGNSSMDKYTGKRDFFM